MPATIARDPRNPDNVYVHANKTVAAQTLRRSHLFKAAHLGGPVKARQLASRFCAWLNLEIEARGNLAWLRREPVTIPEEVLWPGGEPPAPPAARPGGATFREYAERWLDKLETRDLSPATRTNYRNWMRHHFIPLLGDRPIAAITRPEIVAALGRLKRLDGLPFSLRTLRRSAVICLQSCFTEAVVEDGVIPSHPALRLTRHLPREAAPAEDDGPEGDGDAEELHVDPYDAEALRRLLATAADMGRDWHVLLCTVAGSGLRFAEWSSLRSWDVDPARKVIQVRRRQVHGRVGRTLKTPRSRRQVEIDDDLAAMLAGYIAARQQAAAATGRDFAREFLFPAAQRYDRPCPHQTLHARWRRTCRLAGVAYKSPHQLRHTYATLLFAVGRDLDYVSRQLGHSSTQITERIYVHSLPTTDREAVNRLAQLTRPVAGPGLRLVPARPPLPPDPESRAAGTALSRYRTPTGGPGSSPPRGSGAVDA
jgi:integrase